MTVSRRSWRLAAIAAAAILIVACGGETGDNGDATTAPSDRNGAGNGSEVVMEGIAFQPGEITVDAGTTVTWTNKDAVGHTATSDDTLWDSDTLSSGETFTFTFDEPGTYTYFCQVHPAQMQATVVVEG